MSFVRNSRLLAVIDLHAVIFVGRIADHLSSAASFIESLACTKDATAGKATVVNYVASMLITSSQLSTLN